MKIVVDLPDWYIKKAKEIKHPDFVNEAIAEGKEFPDAVKYLFEDKTNEEVINAVLPHVPIKYNQEYDLYYIEFTKDWANGRYIKCRGE